MMRYIGALMVLAFLTGCVQANVERLSPTSYAPIPVEEVTVFLSPEELQADSIAYERVALIYTSGDATFTNQRKHMQKAREEAAKLGCNGLVMMEHEAGGDYNWFWGTSSEEETRVMAIRWWINRKTPK